tara:strand:+ start:278 stop:670 length:393 start_codon:yes stop_codon:yes gene_type:complete
MASDDNRKAWIFGPDGEKELTYKHLSKEETLRLVSVGKSIDIPNLESIVENDSIPTVKQHLFETNQTLLSLHFRAYRNLTKQGYTIGDIAGFRFLSYGELTEEREIMQKRYGGEVTVVGTEYFVEPRRKK